MDFAPAHLPTDPQSPAPSLRPVALKASVKDGLVLRVSDATDHDIAHLSREALYLLLEPV